MEGNARTWFTPKQRAELWERWKSGQCVADIADRLLRRFCPAKIGRFELRIVGQCGGLTGANDAAGF